MKLGNGSRIPADLENPKRFEGESSAFGLPLDNHAYRVNQKGAILTLAELARWANAMMKKKWARDLDVYLLPHGSMEGEELIGGPLVQVEVDGLTFGPTFVLLSYREAAESEQP